MNDKRSEKERKERVREEEKEWETPNRLWNVQSNVKERKIPVKIGKYYCILAEMRMETKNHVDLTLFLCAVNIG